MTLTSAELQEIMPQRAYWARNAGLPAGLRVCNEGTNIYSFIPWAELKVQLEELLLPQLFADPQGYTVGLMDYYGKKDWLMRIFDSNGKAYCSLWFGPDPDNEWHVDGLVRVGLADESPATWMIYQRYSDGSFRRVGGSTTTIDEAIRMIEQKHRSNENDH